MDLGLSTYEIVMLVAGFFTALWAAGKFIMHNSKEAEQQLAKRLNESHHSLSVRMEEAFVKKEVFDKEIGHIHDSIGSLRDEVLKSNACTATGLANLSSRIDALLLAFSSNNKD